MADNDDPLAKFRGLLPSRAELAQLSLLGTSEETRQSAQAILDLLPAMNERERGEYMNETWRLANSISEADMEKSPAGRATLELLRNSKPVGDDIVNHDVTDAEAPEDAQVAIPERPARPESEVDDVNPHLRRLAWPPKPTLQPKATEDDGVKHKWVAAPKTSESRGDQQFLPPDNNSFSNNDPLY